MENIQDGRISPAGTEIMDADLIENVQAVEIRSQFVPVQPDPQVIRAELNRKDKNIRKLKRRVNQLEALLREHGIAYNVNVPHRDAEEEGERRPPDVLVDLEAEPVSPPENEAEELRREFVLPNGLMLLPLPVMRIRRQEMQVVEAGEDAYATLNPTVEARPLTRRGFRGISEYPWQQATTTTVASASPRPGTVTVTGPRRRGRPSKASGASGRGNITSASSTATRATTPLSLPTHPRRRGRPSTSGASVQRNTMRESIAGRTRSRLSSQMNLRERTATRDSCI
ncbi:unnamed protein product [Orchesella dallaii]|uniref:Uncharacterized protein n=1 Tax=Orchesella dallaii TaxID=48710 RepID=A0ABP1RMZ0_9HEXA